MAFGDYEGRPFIEFDKLSECYAAEREFNSIDWKKRSAYKVVCYPYEIGKDGIKRQKTFSDMETST
jgi:hypothetical protein